jgi:beta-lactamase regulating signal transducer with metallopeptidase domain
MLESYLISVAIKSTVLLSAGGLSLRFLGRQDAALRHLVCLAALASAAAVPFLALWSPQWSVLISVPASAGAGSGASSVASGLSNWPMVLAAIWALGILAMAIRTVGGLIVMARIRRRSLYFRNEVRIAAVSTPLTCGVLRPVILLPEAARDWDDLRLRAVLLHESAHVRRRDCLAKYIAQGSRAFLWWNPLAWMLVARLNHEQELACDDAVLSAGVSPETYATVLLDVARDCSSPLVRLCDGRQQRWSIARALPTSIRVAARSGSLDAQNRHCDSSATSFDDHSLFRGKDLPNRPWYCSAQGS